MPRKTEIQPPLEPTRDHDHARDQEHSRELAQRAQRVIWKGGKEATQHPAFVECGYPRYLSHASGAKTWDVDGNLYVDYLMAWGTVLLGHAHAEVDGAASHQFARGAQLNLGVEVEVSLAERLVQRIPGAERVRFLASGAEATTAAVRVARAATGRDHVIQYGFHGWLDWSQAAHPSGIPSATFESVSELVYNDLPTARALFAAHPGKIAALIMEPVKDEMPRPGYLRDLIDLAHEHGALVIFDEAKSGFRLGLGGAQERFGVTADLAVFSKALSNGYPLSAITGRASVFARADGAWVSGTYHGWPPAIAAAGATLGVLEREPVAEHVWTLGTQLMEGVNSIFAGRGLQARLAGAPPMPQLATLDEEAEALRRLFAEMLIRGYFIHPIRPWFISYAHDAACIERTLDDIDAAARALAL